jgi:hypothetical protein
MTSMIFVMIAHLLFTDGSIKDLSNVTIYKTQEECMNDVPAQTMNLPDLPEGTKVLIVCQPQDAKEGSI